MTVIRANGTTGVGRSEPAALVKTMNDENSSRSFEELVAAIKLKRGFSLLRLDPARRAIRPARSKLEVRCRLAEIADKYLRQPDSSDDNGEQPGG